jgi:hypothetical protein
VGERKNLCLKINGILSLMLIAVLASGSLSLKNPRSCASLSLRLESFLRALETSGIEKHFHLYQFRGGNLAWEHGRHATRYQMSVTSSQGLSS